METLGFPRNSILEVVSVAGGGAGLWFTATVLIVRALFKGRSQLCLRFDLPFLF